MRRFNTIADRQLSTKDLTPFSFSFFLQAASLIIRLFRVFYEEAFTTEAPSSQRSEKFLIKNSFLGVLRASAVQSPSPVFIGKPEDPIILHKDLQFSVSGDLLFQPRREVGETSRFRLEAR